MKIWFNTTLAPAVTPVITNVRRGRPMPLKKPSIAQTAAPNAEPATRGNQNCAARSSICGSNPKGARIQWLEAATATNSGTAHSEAHIAVHSA